jgi:gliding motility-associated-like protein
MEPSTQKLRARDKQVIFNNVFPVRFTGGDVELEIEFFGKNTQNGRQFEITAPDGSILVLTEVSTSSPDSCGLSITLFKMPYQIFNSWINNRQIIFVAQAGGSDIGPCGPLVQGSTNDNVSYIRGRLIYTDATFSISSSGATVLGRRTIPNDINEYEWVLNRGRNDVTVYTQDAAGNEGSCQFQIIIEDQEKPEARCKNASLTVNPSGIEGTVIESVLIDNGSSDNCGIVSYQVVPESVDCSLSGTDVPVSLIVTDESGNTDQCQTVIRARPYEVQPTFSSGLCANDTLKLFANVPSSSVAGAYTFHWTGPRPGIEFFTENPVIPNADQSYSGVYVLTVTGFNDCVSVGSVIVNVNPITNPSLTTSDVEICEGDDFILRTTQYSDDVEYEWYAGIFPTGILLSVTSHPELVVKPAETGPLFFYVIASGPDCKSNPSSLVKVTVNQRPVASVNPPFLSLCEGEDIILGTTVTGVGFEYVWTGPNGYSETERNPRIINNATLNEAGDYQLVISYKGCVSDTATTRVVLLERPDAPVIVGNDIFCEGVVFSLVAGGVSNVDRYEWYLNGRLFTTTQDNSLIIPGAIEALQGDWKVKVIKGSCESEFSEGKSVAIDLALQIGASNTGPVCQGDSITLQATFVPNAVYNWDGPAGNIPSVFNPRILAIPGDYSVTITTTTGCQNNANTIVSVIDVPDITALSDDASLCMNETDTIRFAPSVFPNNPDYVYRWEGPAQFSSQERNPVITDLTAEKAGRYTLVIFNNGCPSIPFEKEVEFTLKPPKPQMTYQSPVCQGEDLILTLSEGATGEKYFWSTPSQGIVLSTKDSLIITSASRIHNGFYQVYTELNSCFSELSDSLLVIITPRPSPIPVFGKNIVCFGDTIEIRSQNINGLTYHWSGPQFTSRQAGGITIYPATQNNSGLYSLFVEKDGCLSEESSDFLVEVQEEITKPLITDNIISLCYKDSPGVELCIDPSSLEEGSQYGLWLQEDLFMEGTGPCFYLTDLDSLKEGVNTLFIRAQRGECFSEFSNEIFLTINRPPDVDAEAMESDIRVCPGDEVRLVALSGPPIVRLSWVSPDSDLIISPPDGRSPFVSRLKPGENIVYLTYSVSGCPDFSIDTVHIYREFLPVAADDLYTVGYGQLSRLDVLNNDDFPANTNISIIQFPLSGQTTLEGDTILYEPDLRNIQQQTLTYRICAEFCEDLCDEAKVTIRIDDNIECQVPTIFTPNNDGINDQFIIPCLETGRFPQNRVTVFNEWGDQVHFASPYDNNWDGTYGGNALPVGTYFYVVELEPGRTPVNGFLILQR